MKKFAIAVPIFGLVICFYACSHSPFTPATNATHDTTNATTHITPPPDTTSTSNVADTSVCFARDILPMLQSSCGISGCHDAASAKKGYVYTSYNTIMAYGIVAYKPNSSATYAYCYSGKMPKSPIPKLDSTQMSLLKRWINNGANNDTNCAVNCDTTKYTYSGAIAPIST